MPMNVLSALRRLLILSLAGLLLGPAAGARPR